MFRAAIFDLDGLLIDSEPAHYLAWKKALGMVGKNFSDGEVADFVGKGDEEVAIFFGLETSVLELKNKLLMNNIKDIKIMDGAENLIKLLKLAGMKTGLASSSPKIFVSKIIQRFDGLFDNVLAREDVTRPKPEPEVYLLMSEKLGIGSEDCVAFEDSESGVRAAKKAGMTCVAVPNDFSKSQDFSKADMVVKSLKHMNTEIILKLFKDSLVQMV